MTDISKFNFGNATKTESFRLIALQGLTLLKMMQPKFLKYSEIFFRKWSTSSVRKWALKGNCPDFIELLIYSK